jgi:hypothetical protein
MWRHAIARWELAVDTSITRCRWFNNTFPAIEARKNQFSAYEIWSPILSSRRAPRRYQNRRRIIPGLIPTLDSSCFSRAFVPAVEPITWSFYASLPRNPCSRSPLPQTGDLPRAQTTRKSADALWRPGNSGPERIRPIQTGIRESRFNATVGVQLLGHLNSFQLSNGLLCLTGSMSGSLALNAYRGRDAYCYAPPRTSRVESRRAHGRGRW